MMEQLFREHPEECLRFFKKNIKISLVTGGVLISVHINALVKSQKTWETKNMKDKLLWFWVALRILTYFFQLPIRYKLAKRVWQAHRQHRRAQQGRHLLAMLRMWEWTVVQYISRALLLWIAVTIVWTWWFADLFEDQVHRRSVLLWCWVSVFLLIIQTVISVQWLKRLLNEGWVDNTEISLRDFRNCSDQFNSLEAMKQLLYTRSYPFDRLPIKVNRETLEKDPTKYVQVYIPPHCAICKSGYTISTPSSPLSCNGSTSLVYDEMKHNAHVEVTTLSPSNEAKTITLLPCGHIFHVDCIEAWINLGHSKCPYCNKSTLSDRVWLMLKEEGS